MKKILTISLITFLPMILINCGSTNGASNPEQNSSIASSLDNEKNSSVPIDSNLNRREGNATAVDIDNTLTPKVSNISTKFQLLSDMKESSGLIYIDNNLWTHNDSGDKAKLYQIDKSNGDILKVVSINNAINVDWEDVTYDENYVYIGDFGNNNGNRTDLKIYKISRSELKTETSIDAEVIVFQYSDQENFNDKNFDCEAMIAYNDKLYLFSKDWEDKKTRLYKLDSSKGRQTAEYQDSFNINGLVTGATINKELDILLLSTYSSLLNVNIWSFYNYSNSNFFQGDSKKLTLTTPLKAQIEGITFIDNYKAYLSSEAFSRPQFGISLNANLYELDFSKEFE